MSMQPTHPAASRMWQAPASLAQLQPGVDGVTVTGVLAFLCSFLVVGSGFQALRPEFMGLSVHPYLALILVLFPLAAMARISEFPPRILFAMTVFYGMYFFSIFNGRSLPLGEVFKGAASVCTVITMALLVRRRGDFVAGALGLIIAMALLSVRGLNEDLYKQSEIIQGTNKNSYSLFALPAVLMAGYAVLRYEKLPIVIKAVLAGCTIPVLAVIFMGANRSGYLGSALVGLMLFWDRRGKGILLVGVVALAVGYWVAQKGAGEELVNRWNQTLSGTRSDQYRLDVLIACFQIGIDNPILGVSPQQLPKTIGTYTSLKHHWSHIESHNVFAQIFAGSGLICFAGLMAVGWMLWNWKPADGSKITSKDDPLYAARSLLRMVVLLWCVRGFFTREVMYNPSFNMALGLAIGLCILAEKSRGLSPPANASSPAGRPIVPRPA